MHPKIMPCHDVATQPMVLPFRTHNSDMGENILPIENLISVILTKNTSLQHYVQIAMIQRVFEHALFSRLKVQMHKDLKIDQRPWNWQQYVS